MSDEPKKDGMYIRVELPKGAELKAGDGITFTTRWQSDAQDYPAAAGMADRIAEIIAQHTGMYVVSAHGIALEILDLIEEDRRDPS